LVCALDESGLPTRNRTARNKITAKVKRCIDAVPDTGFSVEPATAGDQRIAWGVSPRNISGTSLKPATAGVEHKAWGVSPRSSGVMTVSP